MTPDEEMALRQLAAGQLVVPKVIELLGPISLWSEADFKRHMRDNITETLDSLTDEQRLEVFAGYCCYCGIKTAQACHCRNDE